MFEYKVRCRHKLGWKEIKLYADTDIEEFFNRNSIDYVRNITDTIENRQLKEIERLNNIIKKIVLSCYNSDMTLGEFKEIWHIAFNEEYIIGNLERLQELKGSDKE